jgi:hypothetical protein
MKLIELQKRFGGKIILNAEYILSIETYSFRDSKGVTTFFTSILLPCGKAVEVMECDNHIIELIQKANP